MSSRFTVKHTPLAGLHVVTRHLQQDTRGYLERLFCRHDLSELLSADSGIVQINRTLTHQRGTVRGMHFQRPPHAELKIVSCIHGAIFDVAVDLRPDSPTFRHWHGVLLDASEHTAFIIPEGFAHGFQSLADDCEILYFHTAFWCPEAEAAIHPLDPSVGIHWPLPITAMSERDRSHAYLERREPPSHVPQGAAA